MLSKLLTNRLKHDLALPILLTIIYLLVIILVRESLPPTEEIIASLSYLYQKYGYQIIFISSMLEALIILNLFAPGGVAMSLGVVFARTNNSELHWIILFALLGIMTGYVVDYLLGYLGFSRVLNDLGYGKTIESSREKLSKSGSNAMILGFLNSNVGAYVSFMVGVIKGNFRQFILISLLASLFWLTLWAILVYALGDIILHILTKYSVLVIVLVILGLILSKVWGRNLKIN